MTTLPSPEEVAGDLLVIDGFLSHEACRRLVRTHAAFRPLQRDSDNSYFVPKARQQDPEGFEVARTVVQRMAGLIETHLGASVGCDLAVLCAITPGFVHRLHADNARVVCARHGDDAEKLVSRNCQCESVEVQPNHTPWRRYTGLLYLSDVHAGGNIVFGGGPNRYGRIFRREITATSGRLVLCPSDELYFHRTTPVTRGVRYSMNCWFTDVPERMSDAYR